MPAARFVERNAPETRRLKPVAVVDILQRSVRLEMDLRLEAAAYSEMAENVADETDFRVPAVDWELTGRDVLVTEWVDGTRLSDRAAIRAAGHDPKLIAAAIVQSFLRHALRDGFFHADMHEGNLFVDSEGRLVAVDLGIMGRIGPKEQRFLAEILLRLHPPRIPAHRRGAFRGGLRAGHPFDARILRRRCGRSASRSTATAPARSPWRSCSASSSR